MKKYDAPPASKLTSVQNLSTEQMRAVMDIEDELVRLDEQDVRDAAYVLNNMKEKLARISR